MAVSAACDLSSLVAELPQQDPFRFVTGVTSIRQADNPPFVGVEVEAYLDVTEQMCKGHFPDALIFPAVLLEEALGQACVLSLGWHPDFVQRGKLIPMWQGDRTVTQGGSIFPGNRVRLQCHLAAEVKEGVNKIYGKMSGEAFVMNGEGKEEMAATMKEASFFLLPTAVAMRLAQMECTRRAQHREKGNGLVNAALERV